MQRLLPPLSALRATAALLLLSLPACVGQPSASRGDDPTDTARQADCFGPDFVVSEVSGPASALPGSPITVTATVCNQGNEYGDTDVTAVLSVDDEIDTGDMPLGTAWIGGLAPGQCGTTGIEGYVGVPEGVYTLGAYADFYNDVPETDETNNGLAAGPFGVGYGPDLVVSSVTGSPSVIPGGSFTTSVTVCNQGTEPSPGTQVSTYLSTDTTITTADFNSGSTWVDPLDIGACTTVAVTGNAWVTPGTYTVGAIVDPMNWVMELIETNNATAGALIGVGFGPDLIVTTVSGPPSATPGGPFTSSVTVCNQGTQPSSPTQVNAYLSTDAVITTTDVLSGNAPVGPLDIGACATVAVPASASVLPGVYTLGAIVDPMNWVPELIETNNATAGGLVGVGFAPDLIVSAVSGPPSATPGATLTTSVTVCNQGTEPSPPTQVNAYLSTDAIITTADFITGNAPVGPLDVGACATVAVPGSASAPPGAYTVGAIVDPMNWVFELIETNNTGAGALVGVGYGPDLVVSSVTGSPSVIPGGSFTTSVTVCNQGTQPSPGTQVSTYLSTDAVITVADFNSGSGWVTPLDIGACTTVAVPGNAWVTPGAYTLGAIVDPMNWVMELIETNNATAGALIGVGFGPDLIVTTVSGPPSAIPGGPFTSSVTVCNQGTQPSSPTQVNAYLSTDATITTSDVLSGNAPVGPLDIGACATVAVPSSASVPPGVYTLGAIVDPMNWVPELIETNNAAAGGLVGVGFAPDLIVSAVSGPPSATPGATLTTSVTVCNQGTEPSPPTQVNAYLSTDAIITTADFITGNAPVGPLDVGACATVAVPGSASAPPGAYTVGAIVDPMNWVFELIETNNTGAGALVGVGYGPDLVVSSVTGSPSVIPGGSFTTSVTVCNQGTEPSPGTQVNTYLSTDAVITAADFNSGSGWVTPLDIGACTTVTVPGNAWVTPGAYTLGAIVDPMNWVMELIETNNATAGALIGVGFGPDLIITTVSGPPSAIPGGPFTSSVTVCNQGTQPSSPTQVNAYLSTDATITTSDFLSGNAPVGPLDIGACATVAVPAGASVPPGVYTLGAIVDPMNWVPELIETNNATAGGLVGVGFAPDLVVSAVSGPPSAIPGAIITTSVTVCNQGTEPSPPTQVNAYLSTDAVITTADFITGNAPVGPLDAGACTTVAVPGSASAPPGAYTVGAIVDPMNWVFELIETNNTGAGALVGVGYGPDLVVSSVTGSPSVIPGGSFTTSVTVCNQGTEPSPGTQVNTYLSTDTTITAADFNSGSGWVNPLDIGACTTVAVPGNAWVTPGAYTLGAIVDPMNWVMELIETNNATAGALIGVGFGPDLIVTTVSGPPSAIPGGPFTSSVTVCNQGTQPSSPTQVNAYLSTDATITTADFLAGNAPVGPLDIGACTTVAVPASASVPPGTYTMGAIVDPMNWVPELIETNNAAAGALVGVGFGPDLIVSAVSSPPSAMPGAPFVTSITVCNQGTEPSPPTQVNAYLSTDATITTDDFITGNAPVGPLAAGACTTVAVPGSASAPPGAYTVGAIVDPMNWVFELIETNNTGTGALVGVGYGPDLVVSSVSGPSSVIPGGSFTTSITVCNQGTQPSPGTQVNAYLSTDTTVTTDDFSPGNAPVVGLAAGACTTVTVTGNAYVPNGAYDVGAIVDPMNWVMELVETNNAATGGSISVGP